MNNFITKGDGKCYIIDALGMNHEVNQWHRMPVPDGIDRRTTAIAYGDGVWLVCTPLPPCPQPKSQAQMQIDADDFTEWRNSEAPYTPVAAWHAALAHERSRKEKS